MLLSVYLETDQVDDKHGEGDDEDVEIELCGHARALVVGLVDQADGVEVLLYLQHPRQPDVGRHGGRHQELAQRPDHVVSVEVAVLLERVAHLDMCRYV